MLVFMAVSLHMQSYALRSHRRYDYLSHSSAESGADHEADYLGMIPHHLWLLCKPEHWHDPTGGHIVQTKVIHDQQFEIEFMKARV
jgi:hypothetical protein